MNENCDESLILLSILSNLLFTDDAMHTQNLQLDQQIKLKDSVDLFKNLQRDIKDVEVLSLKHKRQLISAYKTKETNL